MMPAQKPGASRQDYSTPREFIDAVEREFGLIICDLAAVKSTCVARSGNYYGPDAGGLQDALAATWQGWGGLLWLNPPFGDIAPWAAKCAGEARSGARIALLVPASVGAAWFWDSVAPYARVFALAPRLSFDGKAPYPKDLILAVYGDPALSPGLERWRWKPLQAARSTSAVQL